MEEVKPYRVGANTKEKVNIDFGNSRNRNSASLLTIGLPMVVGEGIDKELLIYPY